MLKQKDNRQIDKKYVPQWYDDLAKKGLKADQSGDVMATRLLPLSEVHFSTRVNGHRAISSMQMITILNVGMLIIFIACFNYLNINLSYIFTRSREIGVRKCMGVSRWKLFLQLWSESFWFVLLPLSFHSYWFITCSFHQRI